MLGERERSVHTQSVNVIYLLWIYMESAHRSRRPIPLRPPRSAHPPITKPHAVPRTFHRPCACSRAQFRLRTKMSNRRRIFVRHPNKQIKFNAHFPWKTKMLLTKCTYELAFVLFFGNVISYSTNVILAALILHVLLVYGNTQRNRLIELCVRRMDLIWIVSSAWT